MPKIKINKFDGIYTDIDENDMRLDIFRHSVNWRHEQGYIEFEPRNLAVLDTPNVDVYIGDLAGTWSWETGIYAILTNDPLALNPLPQQYRVLVLISKKIVGDTTHRLIWIKHLDADSSQWYELSKYGNYANIHIENHNGSGGFNNSQFSTTKSGRVFFRLDQGKIKIFFPHDCFWLGRLERSFAITAYWRPKNFEYTIQHFDFEDTYTIPQVKPFSIINQFYLDRLTEKLNTTSLTNENLYVYTASERRRVDLKDASMRLRIPTRVDVVKFIDASINDKYKYFQSQRRYTGTIQHGDIHLFKFLKCDVNGNPQEDEWITGKSTGNSLYGAPSTGSQTIAPFTDNSNRPWKDDHKLLPGVNYVGDNVINSNHNYYYDRVDKEAFVGPTDWLVSAILDSTTEIIVESGKNQLSPVSHISPTEHEKYFLKFRSIIPENINQRLTHIKYYVRRYFYDEDKKEWLPNFDYEELKTINLLRESKPSYNNLVNLTDTLSANDITGVLLSQNIGITYEANKYNILISFKDFTTEQGISTAIRYDDYINIYHSTVGGGQLLSDLIYDQNKIDLPGIAFINALVGLNGDFLALTNNTSYIIKVAEVAGVLSFAVKDTLEYGVKNARDVSEIQGGVVINTRKGIYITNGYDSTFASEAINNIVKNNYDTSHIIYNRVLHEIYFVPNSEFNSDDIYRFRIERKVWELLDVSYGGLALSDTNDIIMDLDGHKTYITNSSVYGYNATDTTVGTATLTSNTSDLGESTVDKLLNEIEIDYIGSGAIYIYTDDVYQYALELPNSLGRTLKRLFVRLDYRKAFRKFRFSIVNTNKDTKIYGLEFDVTSLKRRS